MLARSTKGGGTGPRSPARGQVTSRGARPLRRRPGAGEAPGSQRAPASRPPALQRCPQEPARRSRPVSRSPPARSDSRTPLAGGQGPWPRAGRWGSLHTVMTRRKWCRAWPGPTGAVCEVPIRPGTRSRDAPPACGAPGRAHQTRRCAGPTPGVRSPGVQTPRAAGRTPSAGRGVQRRERSGAAIVLGGGGSPRTKGGTKPGATRTSLPGASRRSTAAARGVWATTIAARG